jgi:hypothetical protein
MAERFEYLVIEESTIPGRREKDYLNKLGDDGWELTSVVCHPNAAKAFYLKRIKSQRQA